MMRHLVPLVVTAGVMFGHATPASGQEYIGLLSYSYAVPTGDTHNFIDNDSWIGFNFEGRWLFDQKSSVGILLGWQEFYHKVNTDINFNSGTVSGTQYRHMHIFPMMLTGHWYGGIPGGKRPFIGGGLGTTYVRQLFDIGLQEATEDHWHFALAGDAGIAWPLQSGSAAVLSLRYTYPFNAGDYVGGGSRAWQYLSINLGVAYIP